MDSPAAGVTSAGRCGLLSEFFDHLFISLVVHRSLGDISPAGVRTKSSTFCATADIYSWSVGDVVDFVSLVPGCSRYAEVNH